MDQAERSGGCDCHKPPSLLLVGVCISYVYSIIEIWSLAILFSISSVEPMKLEKCRASRDVYYNMPDFRHSSSLFYRNKCSLKVCLSGLQRLPLQLHGPAGRLHACSMFMYVCLLNCILVRVVNLMHLHGNVRYH